MTCGPQRYRQLLHQHWLRVLLCVLCLAALSSFFFDAKTALAVFLGGFVWLVGSRYLLAATIKTLQLTCAKTSWFKFLRAEWLKLLMTSISLAWLAQLTQQPLSLFAGYLLAQACILLPMPSRGVYG